MTTFARLPLLHALTRRAAAFGLLFAAGLIATCLLGAQPAGAVVIEDSESSVFAGVQPRNESSVKDGPRERIEPLPTEPTEPFKAITPDRPNEFANATGAPVLHGSAVYVIYWDPTDHYHSDWKEKVDEFVEHIGASNNSLGDVLAVDAQYTDRSDLPAYNRVAFRGAAEDTEAYPTSGCTDPHPFTQDESLHAYALGCLTDQQVREQLQHFIEIHGLPKGMNTVYYLLTPPGLTVCLDKGGAGGRCSDFEENIAKKEVNKKSYENSFCSYHSDINPGTLPTGDGNTVIYSVIPWTAGGLGDGQLSPIDRTQSDDCQDGGFNPEEKGEEIKQSPPVQQEPNQPAKCPTGISDGFCDTGLADLIINQISQEQQNVETDPLLNAWRDPAGNEVADECRNFFAPVEGGSYAANPATGAGSLSNQTIDGGQYYLNLAFNLAGLRLVYPGVPCMPGVNLLPKFTAPSPVNAGEIVTFDGMESTITLNSAFKYGLNGLPEANYATYKWNFGDGSTEISGYAPGAPLCSEPWLSPCAASVFHAYTYGGTYNVTLTVTDVGGNVASITKPITVAGSPPPTPGSEPGTTPGSTGSTGSTGTTTGTTTTTTISSNLESVPAPRVTSAIVSRSLKNVLGKAGLVVHYTVNEQVAGRFEVLLARTTARRLGITGTPATGLAPGTAPQLVIAKAILVTTKGGASTVHIVFSKAVAAKLRHAHNVLVMLRLSVRNAASHQPTSTTVLSTVTLH